MALPSVWAQGKQLQEATGAPEPPSVWAPVGLDPQADAIRAALPDKPSGLPSVWAPSNPQPTVTLAKMPPDPGQQQITHDQQQLVKMQTEDKTPWGSPTNHPGKLGKTAHVFATLGNIAGDIFAPNVMARVPGTQAYRAGEEDYLSGRLAKELTEEQQRALDAANTAGKKVDTELAPGEAAALEGQENATAAKDNLATASGPDLLQSYSHRVNQVIAQGGDPNADPIVNQLADRITSIQKQPLPKGGEHVDLVGPDGKPMAATYDPEKKQYLDSKGNVIDNPRPYEKPDQAGMVTVVAPDPNNPGGGIVQRLGTGARIAPGSVTSTQFGSMNTPTTNQRTAAGRAETVLAMVPEVTQRIDATASQMGPEMGRWNDFMQGKIGNDNPEFAALRSDLLMMSSAVALAHAQGRLPENLREEFDKAINAPQQTPENLKATIQAMVPWLQKVQDQGERGGTGQAQQSGAPGGARFQGKGSDGKMYWLDANHKPIAEAK